VIGAIVAAAYLVFLLVPDRREARPVTAIPGPVAA
jgi:hypothetical protein